MIFSDRRLYYSRTKSLRDGLPRLRRSDFTFFKKAVDSDSKIEYCLSCDA